MNKQYWKDRHVTITGGAALIGSHLTDTLLEAGAKVRVVDDLSAGKLEYVHPDAEFYELDLRDYDNARDAVDDSDVVFHLACQHGGRGYVDTHPINSYDNVALDGTVFRAIADARGRREPPIRTVFASSACAYPVDLQNSDDSKPLREEELDYNCIRNPDGAYGFAKLAGELTLNAYTEAQKINGVSARQFTVYGERMGETHAICALIAKTFIKQDPFEVWGTGKQQRNWTYVGDTVQGLILLAENEHLNGAWNLGVEQRYTVDFACRLIWDRLGWEPKEVTYKPQALTGPYNRIADAGLIRRLGWKPQVDLGEGISRVAEWYVETHDVDEVREDLERRLRER